MFRYLTDVTYYTLYKTCICCVGPTPALTCTLQPVHLQETFTEHAFTYSMSSYLTLVLYSTFGRHLNLHRLEVSRWLRWVSRGTWGIWQLTALTVNAPGTCHRIGLALSSATIPLQGKLYKSWVRIKWQTDSWGRLLDIMIGWVAEVDVTICCTRCLTHVSF